MFSMEDDELSPETSSLSKKRRLTTFKVGFRATASFLECGTKWGSNPGCIDEFLDAEW